jgi:hypothetical protein
LYFSLRPLFKVNLGKGPEYPPHSNKGLTGTGDDHVSRLAPIPVTTETAIQGFTSFRLIPGSIPTIIPPTDFAPQAAAFPSAKKHGPLFRDPSTHFKRNLRRLPLTFPVSDHLM